MDILQRQKLRDYIENITYKLKSNIIKFLKKQFYCVLKNKK